MKGSLEKAFEEISLAFARSSKHVFLTTQLAEFLETHRRSWRIAKSVRSPRFISFLIEKEILGEVELVSPDYTNLIRYCTGQPSPFELALSIHPASYLTHATALYLHGLSDEIPRVVYLNREQTKKHRVSVVTQGGIDRAFASRQRLSKLIYSYQDARIVVLSGKHLDGLGVVRVKNPELGQIRATGIERTLVDIVVRPAYAGGIFRVLEAFSAARERVDVPRLFQILRKMDHAYPYHQAIGFLMEQVGFPEEALNQASQLGLQFDFYLTHAMKEKDFDPRWRIYYPVGLSSNAFKRRAPSSATESTY